MATLNDGVKAFIVQALACFDSPTQVAALVKEEFGLELDRQRVSAYDPNKSQGRNLSKKWRDYFNSEREKFKKDREAIPIANRAYRLRRLQHIVDHAGKNNMLVMAALEQAAKDEGGMYEAKRNDNDSLVIAQPVQVIVDVVDARVKPDDSAED